MLEIIGAPFDLCGSRRGSRLGPSAIRLAGIKQVLTHLGFEVEDQGDLPCDLSSGAPHPTEDFAKLLEIMGHVRRATAEALERNSIPLVLGGEHTISVAAISAALAHFGQGLAVLWIDAHADLNTPGTSATGNIHGMPLAALAGLPSGSEGEKDLNWRRLLDKLGPSRLDLSHLSWYGLRDVDLGERPRLQGLTHTMHDIDRRGIQATLGEFDHWMRYEGHTHLWVSFDVDALDPILAPGTGTAVRGGLSYREAHLVAELLREQLDTRNCPYRLAGVDVAETNPIYDTMNQTAVMATEWVASLFGQTILGKKS